MGANNGKIQSVAMETRVLIQPGPKPYATIAAGRPELGTCRQLKQ